MCNLATCENELKTPVQYEAKLAAPSFFLDFPCIFSGFVNRWVGKCVSKCAFGNGASPAYARSCVEKLLLKRRAAAGSAQRFVRKHLAKISFQTFLNVKLQYSNKPEPRSNDTLKGGHTFLYFVNYINDTDVRTRCTATLVVKQENRFHFSFYLVYFTLPFKSDRISSMKNEKYSCICCCGSVFPS